MAPHPVRAAGPNKLPSRLLEAWANLERDPCPAEPGKLRVTAQSRLQTPPHGDLRAGAR